MKIAEYSEKFREDVRNVCLLTGPSEALTDNVVKSYILNMYCNYYIDKEPENVFVLENDDGVGCGYILSAPSFCKFRKEMKEYLKVINCTGTKNVIEAYSEIFGLFLFRRKYPAHIHIDIIDGYTGKGYGSLMMDKMLSHLADKNVRGVCLIVGSFNKGAINFYRRHGFESKMKLFGGVVMCRNLA